MSFSKIFCRFLCWLHSLFFVVCEKHAKKRNIKLRKRIFDNQKHQNWFLSFVVRLCVRHLVVVSMFLSFSIFMSFPYVLSSCFNSFFNLSFSSCFLTCLFIFIFILLSFYLLLCGMSMSFFFPFLPTLLYACHFFVVCQVSLVPFFSLFFSFFKKCVRFHLCS